MEETNVLHKKKVVAPKLRFKGFEDSWIKSRLGDIAIITTGNTPSTTVAEYYNGPKLFVSPADINENRYVYKTKTTLTDLGFKQGRKITIGSILFVCIGSTIGKVAQATDECLTNQQINALDAINGFDNNFIYAILERNGKKIKLLAGTQAVPQINKTDFSNFKYNFPTLPEQQKIAAFLSAVDEKIAVQTQCLASLRQYKKGVMQQLFSGKLRFKDENGKAYPKWGIIMLGDICSEITYGLTVRPTFVDNGIPLISAREISKGFVNYEVAPQISLEDFNNLSKKAKPQKGDLFLSKTGSIGFSALVEIEKTIAITQNIAIIRLKDEKANSTKFLLQFFRTKQFLKTAISKINQSTIMDLQLGDIKKLPIPSVCIEEQKKIADFLSVIDVKIEKVSKQITQTQTFKKGLLQQMFV